MATKPSLPKGVRDMLPQTMLQREYIVEQITTVFKKYGYQPIETPAMEKHDTLTGKYGEEGDRLIFKILPRGRKLEKAVNQLRQDEKASAVSLKTDEALRYDLTVPFARFVVQNQNELTFPFKRYQIQPVWRADRPQKGRYREFFQCDADAVGSDSLLLELEFIAIYREVFERLQLPISLKLNNRKVLAGLAENFGIKEAFTDFTVALDKLDKVGLEGVKTELEQKNMPAKALKGVEKIAALKGSDAEKLKVLDELVKGSSIGEKGVEELRFLLQSAEEQNLADVLEIDLTLARGLDYYTGAIYEVIAREKDMGSLGGGGRYDDLTGIFGLKNLSGIGISFGLERIHLVLEEAGLIPTMQAQGTEVLFVNFGMKEALFATQMAAELRKLGVKCEVYPDPAKMSKQLDYANKKGIPLVIMAGEQEIEAGNFTLKNMQSGEQNSLGKIELLEKFNPGKSGNHGVH